MSPVSTKDYATCRFLKASTRSHRPLADLRGPAGGPEYLLRHQDPTTLAAGMPDAELVSQLVELWKDNYRVYGARKLWKAARRAGLDVGRDQVARLMRVAGIEGARRTKRVRTTRADPVAARHPDLVQRHFQAHAPNQLWVTDLTFVPTWSGVAYVCFIVNAFSRMIVGWRVSPHMRTSMVLDAIEMARWSRGTRLDGLRCHSDAGSQGGFNWSSQHLDRGGVLMGRPAGWMKALTGRSAMKSPGRPSLRREVRAGVLARDREGAHERGRGGRVSACRGRLAAGGSAKRGGMPSIDLSPLSGRYLSFAEREEIAILQGAGGRGARDRSAAGPVAVDDLA